MKKFFSSFENKIIKVRNVKRYEDITGRKFNRLFAISYSHSGGKTRSSYWNFICDCGKEFVTSAHSVKHGLTKSCGCLNIESRLKMVKSKETRIKRSLSLKGDKCHFWRGGKTKENRLIRESVEYKLWRESVFERDNWTCVFCFTHGIELNADHIKPFCNYPELRFAIDNGRTLCVPCHRKTDTYGNGAKTR